MVRHGEVFVPSVERMKNCLPTDFFELAQECLLRTAIFTFTDHIIIRLTGKIGIDENGLAFAEEGLHGIISYLYGEGAFAWNIRIEQRLSVDETRRLFGCDYLVNLIPTQERHFPHPAGRGGMGVVW